MRGLLVDVYKNRHDCTNGGASSKYREFVLTGTNPLNGITVTGPFEPIPEIPELVLVAGPLHTVRAVPRELLESGEWVMFGGNFCYTEGVNYIMSRNPLKEGDSLQCIAFHHLLYGSCRAPIKIFDRVEGRR